MVFGANGTAQSYAKLSVIVPLDIDEAWYKFQLVPRIDKEGYDVFSVRCPALIIRKKRIVVPYDV